MAKPAATVTDRLGRRAADSAQGAGPGLQVRRRARQVGRRPDRRGRTGPQVPAQGLPRPLVVPAGRGSAVLVHHLAAHRRLPDHLVQAVDGRDRVRGHLPTAARRLHVGVVRVDAGPFVRHPRRPADPADAPLGGHALRGGHAGPQPAHLLHRCIPQAAGDQLADRCRHAGHGCHRGLRRLLAARRSAVRHRPAVRGRADPLRPDHRHVGGVLRLRRRVPGRTDRSAALHGPHLVGPGGPARA